MTKGAADELRVRIGNAIELELIGGWRLFIAIAVLAVAIKTGVLPLDIFALAKWLR